MPTKNEKSCVFATMQFFKVSHFLYFDTRDIFASKTSEEIITKIIKFNNKR